MYSINVLIVVVMEVSYFYIPLTDGHLFNGLFSRTTWVSWHQKGETNLDFNKARHDSDSGISWTVCKSFAPRFRQITTTAYYH